MATARNKARTDWLSLNGAAKALGESRLAVLALIVKGDLVGQHIAERTVVRRDTVDALLATRAEAAGRVA